MLENKTIVVTGCASGIGLETSRVLAEQGATVIGVDRTETDATTSFFQADLSDPSSIDELVAALPGSIDGLCNIAGLPPTAPAASVLRVNALGLQRLTLGLIPKMADGASITNLASLAGNRWAQAIDLINEFDAIDFDTVADFCNRHNMDDDAQSYFFSKAFVVTWTMRNRWTWRDRGIRMNAISPGPVDTPILPDFMATLGDRAKAHELVMDRHGIPADVAPVVAFMQSDDSHWIRGANIPVDGGLASHMTLASTNLND